MKRRRLLRHLERDGCSKLRQGEVTRSMRIVPRANPAPFRVIAKSTIFCHAKFAEILKCRKLNRLADDARLTGIDN